MTSQNYPNQDPRIPQIIEERLHGATWEEAAGSVGLTRRAVYDIRQKDEFHFLVDTLVPKTDKILDELLDSEQHSIRMEAVKEVGRMRRALIPKRIEKREDITIQHNIDITEQRKEADELITKLKFTDAQYRILEENVISENADLEK